MKTSQLVTDPRKAIAGGFKRYYGKPCVVHPELSGERNARSRACIGCAREKMRERRATNPEYHRLATRKAYEKWYARNAVVIRAKVRQKRTGISQEILQRLLILQDGKCAICFSVLGDKIHADHCHDTHRPRGLLCGNCNRAEGMIRRSKLDPAEFGKRLSEYLKNPPARKLDN